MKQKDNPDIFRQFCVSEGLPAPKPEYTFHPERKWRVDWYFEANGYQVALEVEGAIFGRQVICHQCHVPVVSKNGKKIMQGGRHSSGSGFAGDLEKYNALAMAGIWLLRVSPKELMTVKTLQMVKAVLEI